MGDKLDNPNPAARTPMLAQYLDIKSKYPDAILFYRMGDFYEMFFEDALKAAPVLEVQLTCRDKNAENPIPMCGIPHHSAQGYLQKMLEAGFKVALCEQVEDPATTKGLVKREVVRVVTPALVGDPELLAEDRKPLLVALQKSKSGWHVASLDLLDSELRNGAIADDIALLDWILTNRPCEWLVSEEIANNPVLANAKDLLPVVAVTLRPHYFEEEKESKGLATLKAIRLYLRETQRLDSLPLLSEALPLRCAKSLVLDSTTIRSLDLVPASRETATGHSLFEVMDKCSTAMGRRHLKQTILAPSTDAQLIEQRLDSVEELFESPQLLDELKTRLREVRDIERLVSKISLGLAMPRDLVAIRQVQKIIPEIKIRLASAKTAKLLSIENELAPLAELTDRLERALQEPAPATLRDGNIFLAGYHPEISNLRELSGNAKVQIATMETRERERTGISSLKIKYSRVFGYTIEITKSHLTKVPEDYIRKQTIANGERYITVALKEFEEKALTAEQRLKSLEEELFFELRDAVAAEAEALLKNARMLAELDLLLCFTSLSREKSYVKPSFHSEKSLRIEEGRHPTVEAFMAAGKFVPNTVEFSEEAGWTWILTGPNMGGKSTIMRQTALICLMAQSGCFVPASAATLPILDSVFTRVGSSDDLAQGRSTFMVEMAEISRILKSATSQSLILIDEIGRGTSTYDGLALAWSLLEYTHQKVAAKTFFATHFHEITSLENQLPGLKNYHVQVQKFEDTVLFLYKLSAGVCHRSYGIDVAKLAGVPGEVIERAKLIQQHLEGQSQRITKARIKGSEITQNQLDFFAPA